MVSRSLTDLRPPVALKARLFLERCHEAKQDVLIYCTLRTCDEQSKLYRQGRSTKQIEDKARSLRERGYPMLAEQLLAFGPTRGYVVTHAGPGESAHQYGLAFDAVPVAGGKLGWDDEPGYDRIGRIGQAVGLEWGGDWERFQDRPHFQDLLGVSLEEWMREYYGRRT